MLCSCTTVYAEEQYAVIPSTCIYVDFNFDSVEWCHGKVAHGDLLVIPHLQRFLMLRSGS